jgi:hypothetical protein
MVWAFQQPATAPDAERRAYAYAIYSLLLTNQQTSHGPDDNDMYFIGDTTVAGTPREPCVRVPAGAKDRFTEVMADFEQRKDAPATLERSFRITKPYRLLSAAEVNEFITAHVSAGTADHPAGSPKVTDLFRLTDVYFDRNRTLALTAISTWCGGLCAQYQWKVLEKTADGWMERPWVSCAAMASGWRQRGDVY